MLASHGEQVAVDPNQLWGSDDDRESEDSARPRLHRSQHLPAAAEAELEGRRVPGRRSFRALPGDAVRGRHRLSRRPERPDRGVARGHDEHVRLGLGRVRGPCRPRPRPVVGEDQPRARSTARRRSVSRSTSGRPSRRRSRSPRRPLRLNRPAAPRRHGALLLRPSGDRGRRALAGRARAGLAVVVGMLVLGRLGPAATRSQTVATGSAALDADGRFRIDFTPEADERKPKEVTYRYSVTADVTDDGGETRSVTRAYRLGFVSVEATVQTDTAFLREGEQAELVVRRADLDGAPRAGDGELAAAGARPAAEDARPGRSAAAGGGRRRGRYRTAGRPPAPALGARLRARGGAGQLARRRAAAGREARSTRANGEATLRLRGLPPGAYRLRYETKDDFGATFALAKDLVVAGRESTRLQLPALLLAERSSVRVGETARLLAVSGFPDRPAGRRRREGRPARGPSRPHGGARPDAPRDPDHRGRPRRLRRHAHGRPRPPARHADRSGVRALGRPRAEARRSRPSAIGCAPARRRRWRVNVRSADGKPPEAGAAELLAYMYDRSLDVFAPHNPPSVRSPLSHADRDVVGASEPRPGPAPGTCWRQASPSVPRPRRS